MSFDEISTRIGYIGKKLEREIDGFVKSIF